MNLLKIIESYRERGFSREQAEVIALMQLAAGILFRDFPDTFLLFGGAPLVLFHGSVRHSADLDLLGTAEDLPTPQGLGASLEKGLASAAETLNVGPLRIGVSGNHVVVNDRNDQLLFKVDITRMGSVIESEVREYEIDIGDDKAVKVKAPSGNYLLFQKAECFLGRKNVKARDAYDIYGSTKSGKQLNKHLEAHLDDGYRATRLRERT